MESSYPREVGEWGPAGKTPSGLAGGPALLAMLTVLVVLALLLVAPSSGVEPLGGLGGRGASRHTHLYLARQVEQIVRPSPGLDHVLHQLEPPFRWHTERGERSGYAQRECRVIGGPADAP